MPLGSLTKLTLCTLLLAMTAFGASKAGARSDPMRTPHMRLVAVGTRLAIANVSLCERRQYQPGLVVHDLSQYDRGERAARMLSSSNSPARSALPDGASARTPGPSARP